jgi:hypothetical protein
VKKQLCRLNNGRLFFTMRLEQIETKLGDEQRTVTPEQASQISQAVKAVAIALGQQTRKNEFGAVYGELYRQFGIMWNLNDCLRQARLSLSHSSVKLLGIAQPS